MPRARLMIRANRKFSGMEDVDYFPTPAYRKRIVSCACDRARLIKGHMHADSLNATPSSVLVSEKLGMVRRWPWAWNLRTVALACQFLESCSLTISLHFG
jgi:hypothetical protein